MAAEDIHDIRGPIHLTPPWMKALWILLGALILAILGVMIRHFRKQARAPSKLPHEIAWEELQETLKILKPGNAREFSIAISWIIRTYIEARFQVRAAHRTTEEFLHDLLNHSQSPLAQYSSALNDFLYHCDLAKFARWELNVDEMKAMHGSARRFVEETRPQPEPASAKPR